MKVIPIHGFVVKINSILGCEVVGKLQNFPFMFQKKGARSLEHEMNRPLASKWAGLLSLSRSEFSAMNKDRQGE